MLYKDFSFCNKRVILVYSAIYCFFAYKSHCDLARLHSLHKTFYVDFTLGSPDWTVQLNAYTVNVVPARIKQVFGVLSKQRTNRIREKSVGFFLTTNGKNRSF